jgi:hypothetical protein
VESGNIGASFVSARHSPSATVLNIYFLTVEEMKKRNRIQQIGVDIVHGK